MFPCIYLQKLLIYASPSNMYKIMKLSTTVPKWIQLAMNKMYAK